MLNQSLEGLIERAEKATGPDREIDAELMALVYTRDERHIGATEDSGPGGTWVPVKDSVWVDPATDKWVSTAAYDFTRSVDAALGLCERMLPGAIRRAHDAEDGIGAKADLVLEGGDHIMAHASTWPLAIILATLRSIQSSKTGGA